MTSRRSILLGLVLGAFLGVFGLNSVYAQVPRSISYQGLLLKNNQPVTGTVKIDVTIYDAAGTILYQETPNSGQVQVDNGIFNILIGDINGHLPANLTFDEQYYLGINIDNTGEVSPRTPLVAAPYALNSQTVGGVGVSVTPKAGMLLPLDANGLVPKTALPQSTQALTTIDGLVGDASGNIKINGLNGITITDIAPGQINIGFSGGGATADTLIPGLGLTGGGIGTKWTIGIAPNGITPNMLGTSSVTGSKIDQTVPQWGLFQDALGDLNVGLDNTLTFISNPTKPNLAPSRNAPFALDGIGLNLNNPNTWTALQTFNSGITVNGTTILNGPVTLTPGTLTINGTPEPLAGPNAATYEIIDNGDLKVTGSSYLVGNTYIGAATTGGTNTMGTAGATGSANTITGNTNAVTGATSNTITGGTNTVTGTANTITGTTSNSIQSPSNSIGTTNAASANTIGNAGTSVNTITGATNSVTGTTANNVQAPTNNVGTSQAAGGANNIGTAAISTNTVTGTTNNVTGSVANNVQSPANSIGTAQVAGGTNTIGTAGISTNNTTGTTNTTTGSVANNSQAPTVNIGTTQVAGGVINHGTAGVTTNNIAGLVNNVQSQTNNVGTTQTAGGANNVGTAGISTNTITGLTNSTLGTTNNSQAQTINTGTTQTAGGIITIGTAAISTVTINGLSTTINGPTIHNGNITQTSGTTTLLTTQTGNLTVVGTMTQSGGNAQIAGGASNTFGSFAGSNNAIGAAGSTNTYNGQNNFNGNITQVAGTSTLLNTQINGTLGSTGNITLGTTSSNNNIGNAGAINTLTGTTNNLTGGTNNLTGATNNVNANVNNIGNNSGSVNNIGVVSGGGISTNNVGNLNTGTNNNINGTSTFQGATIPADGSQILRVTGGPQSCAGPLPTSLTSQAFFDGDVWDAGTLSACRLNIFGSSGSCISNLNTSTFGACAGGASTIALISGFTGNKAPNGGFPINITNIDNIQANTSIQTNVTLTIGVPGTNATNITSSNAGPASIAQQTPSVAGRIPTFQQYQLALVPGTGPNGGGSVTFTTVNAPGLNFDALSGLTISYRTRNATFPQGELTITQTLTDITVESSAAGDNNTVQLIILRP